MCAFRNSYHLIFFFWCKIDSPPDAGLPISGGDLQYVVIEIHYDNPMLSHSNQADNSGLKLLYTPKKRKYDAQVMSMGYPISRDRPFISLPPEQPEVKAHAYCPSEATTVSQSISFWTFLK